MISTTLLSVIYAVISVYISNVEAQSTDPCAVVADAQLQLYKATKLKKDADIGDYVRFNAETAYECINSVPLNQTQAIQMIDIAVQYYSFQSTLAYLKDPPKSYQQPSVDVLGRFSQMHQKLNAGGYSNQYELDKDLYSISRDTHEGHFGMSVGVLGLFQWLLPDTLVSFSIDGKETPKVYSYLDILNNVQNPSHIVQLGGQPVYSYLRNYLATNTRNIGRIEPHAEWNVLMFNSAAQFSAFGSGNSKTYTPGYFESTMIYNGPFLKVGFANGSSVEWPYQAASDALLSEKGYTSGKNIYEALVLKPKSLNAAGKRATDTIDEDSDTIVDEISGMIVKRADYPTTKTKVPFSNYPADPVVLQKNFSSGGTVSGYLLESDSIGVLSLPSFMTSVNADALSFHDAVANFINISRSTNMKKIVIDLSGNGGGSVFAGYDTFRQFFPNTISGSAIQARITPSLNTYGSILTGLARDNGTVATTSDKLIFRDNYNTGAGQINAAITLDEDRTTWKSWGSFYTPKTTHGDEFSKLATYNLSHPFITNELGFSITNTGNNKPPYTAPPWAAKDIILLHDGSCGSTCNIFADMMKNDAGVKSVAVGGIPQNSPMQGVAGTRGTVVVPWSQYSDLTNNIGIYRRNSPYAANALSEFGLSDHDLDQLPPTLEQAPWWIRAGNVNGLDMIRLSSPEDPRQFAYEASNCRLFYTNEMLKDIRVLWRAAAAVAGGDNTQCVPGSTDAPGSGINQTVTGFVGFNADTMWSKANSTDIVRGNS